MELRIGILFTRMNYVPTYLRYLLQTMRGKEHLIRPHFLKGKASNTRELNDVYDVQKRNLLDEHLSVMLCLVLE